MAVCARIFTVKADSAGRDVVAVPPYEGWILQMVRFLTPESPRLRLPNGANVRLFDPVLDGDIMNLGLLANAIGFNTGVLIETAQETYKIWAATSHLTRASTTGYTTVAWNPTYINDWETQVIADPPANTSNIVAGAEWDVQIVLTDNVAGRNPAAPYPKGFLAIN